MVNAEELDDAARLAKQADEDRRATRFMKALTAVKYRGDDGYTELANLNALIKRWLAGGEP